MAISFKSVGETEDDIIDQFIIKSPVPLGIKTPLRLSTSNDFFEMHYSLEDQAADNLKNLLLTNWGERICSYDFGANLRPLTTDFSTKDDFDTEAISRIQRAVQKWMPYIDLVDFSSEINRTENQITGVIKIDISYNVPSLYVTNKKIQVVLYVI